MTEYAGIAFDLDRTAVPNGASSVESDRLIEAIGGLSDETLAFAATGRSAEFALPITRGLGLRNESVIANGAQIVDSQSGDVRWSRVLSDEQVGSVIAACNGYEVPLFLPGDDPEETILVAEQLARTVPAAYLQRVRAEDADIIIPRLLGIDGVWAYQSPSWSMVDGEVDINIGHEEARKDLALAVLFDQYGIDGERFIGVGDGANDIGLFTVVGLKVAVANAEAELLAMADEIAPSQQDDGLAVVIEKYLH